MFFHFSDELFHIYIINRQIEALCDPIFQVRQKIILGVIDYPGMIKP